MYQTRGMDEFKQLHKKQTVKIIDVREEEEYIRGHISKAIHLPLSQIQERLALLDKEQEYYVICQSGGRSQIACEFLASQGYQVINVLGGMSAWQGEIVFGL